MVGSELGVRYFHGLHACLRSSLELEGYAVI